MDGTVVKKLEEARKAKDASLAAAANIVAAYDLAPIRNRIETELPEKIRLKTLEIKDLERRLRAAQEDVELAEARLQSDIAAEIDDKTGKPKFSNDTARKAELAIRKRHDADYRLLSEEAARIEGELDTARADLITLERQWNGAKAALESMTAELQVLAR